MDNEKVKALVYNAIDEVNELLESEQQITKSDETVLFGEEGVLDSLGLVKLIVAVEGKVQEEFDVPVTLANEKAMSMKNNPFQTVGALTAFTTSLLEEEHAS